MRKIANLNHSLMQQKVRNTKIQDAAVRHGSNIFGPNLFQFQPVATTFNGFS